MDQDPTEQSEVYAPDQFDGAYGDDLSNDVYREEFDPAEFDPAEFDPAEWGASLSDAGPESRIDFAIARAEFAGRDMARAAARRLLAIHETVRGARENPGSVHPVRPVA